MSRRRFENLDPDRQKRLFDSAATEFGDKGYDGASLNRILDKSGMSKSSLYYYFDDKADLFTTMLERAMEFLFKQVGGMDIEALTAETYWPEIESMALKLIRVVDSSSWYVKMGRAFYRLRGAGKDTATTSRVFSVARHWTEKLLVKGQQLGVVRADVPNSLLIDSTMGLGEALDRWSVEHWDDLDEQERLAITSTQIGLLRSLLEAGPKTPSA